MDSLTGEPTLDIGLGDIHAPEVTLEEIFAYLEQAEKPCIVAIDEFQQIGKYPEKSVEAILRTKVRIPLLPDKSLLARSCFRACRRSKKRS